MKTEESVETKSSLPRVLAAVQDLLFTAKITAAAKRTGVPVEFVRGEEELIQKTESGSSMILLDLNHPVWNVVELIAKLKANPAGRQRPQRTIIGYVSHVQQGLIRQAQKAGCDVVLPRSVFSQNLDELLRQRSCHLQDSCG